LHEDAVVTEAAGGDEVTDDVRRHRFVLGDAAGLSELIYRLNGKRLVLVHTGVPEGLRGEGRGGRLVEAAVERAEREQLKVVPLCPFARKWLEEHPSVASRIDIDWGAHE
jgi:predicted GNAT family acetyltransferase